MGTAGEPDPAAQVAELTGVCSPTFTGGGQVQFLDTRHRTQAHVEDRIQQFTACGARNLSSIDYAVTPPGCNWPPWPPR